MRRVFVCLKCRARQALRDGKQAPEFVPECQLHGPMVRQANAPYRGESTEPTDPAVPPARDFPRAPAGLKPAA